MLSEIIGVIITALILIASIPVMLYQSVSDAMRPAMNATSKQHITTLPWQAFPLTALSDTELLISYKGHIAHLNLATNAISTTTHLVDSEDVNANRACFDGSRKAIWTETVSDTTTNIVKDFSTGTTYTFPEDRETWSTFNPLDCTATFTTPTKQDCTGKPYFCRTHQDAKAEEEGEESAENIETAVFHPVANYYLPTTIGQLFQRKASGGYEELQLRTPSGTITNLPETFTLPSRGEQRPVWDIAQRVTYWPATGMVLHWDTLQSHLLTIPEGPWNSKQATKSDPTGMRFFSCGIGCYMHEDIKMANAKLLTIVTGKAYRDSYKGIYLQGTSTGETTVSVSNSPSVGGESGSTWTKIVSGDVTNVIMSDSGCLIAWARKDKLEYTNLCKHS